MKDIEKVLTEVREAAKALADDHPYYDEDHCRKLAIRVQDALSDFTAEMPGAIGRVIRNPEHEAICATGNGPTRECDCGLSAALAKLEVKP